MKLGLRIVAVIFFATFFASQSKASQTMTLEEAKRMALESNLELRSLKQNLDEQRATVKRANSNFLPRFGLGAGINKEPATTDNQLAPIGYLYGTYNIFRGNEDNYRSQIANLEQSKAELQFKKAKLRTELEVERQFGLCLLKQNVLEIRRQALEVNQTYKKMAQKRLNSGLDSESDILQFDLRESILESDLISSRQDLNEARINLLRVFGDKSDVDIVPVGALEDMAVHRESISLNLDQVKAENEIVLTTGVDLAISEVNSKMWRSKWLPTIDVTAQAGYLPDAPEATGATIGGNVLLKWEFYSGGDTAAQKQEGEARKLKLETQFNDAILAAKTRATVALQRIQTLSERIRLENENIDRAEKYYRVILKEYQKGIRDSGAVKVAAESIYDARIRREGFQYDVVAQRIDLESALGAPIEKE